MSSVATHWLARILPNGHGGSPRMACANIYGVRFDGETWSVATDGRVLVAEKGDFGGVEFKGKSPSFVKTLMAPAFEPRATTLEAIRQWCGGVEQATEAKCIECDGEGTAPCHQCGQDAECEDCEGSGKVLTHPGRRPGAIAGITIDRQLLAIALDGGHVGPCSVRAGEWLYVRSDSLIVVLAGLEHRGSYGEIKQDPCDYADFSFEEAIQ